MNQSPAGQNHLPLNEERLRRAAELLADRDPDLRRVVAAIGPPPLWDRPPGFATLIYIILEQQVSLSSARAAYNRLAALLDPISPQAFLTLDDATLKSVGFSRQKTGYGRELARAVLEGRLDLNALHKMEDEAVRAELVKIKGIGRWTADIYLMEVLLRPDVWPSGDLALAIAVQIVKGMTACPTPLELEALGDVYRPFRAAAARLFWHHYLSIPGRKTGSITPAV